MQGFSVVPQVCSEPNVSITAKYMTDSIAPRGASIAPTEVSQADLWFANI